MINGIQILPQKIRPTITTSDFKKFRPRTLQKEEHPRPKTPTPVGLLRTQRVPITVPLKPINNKKPPAPTQPIGAIKPTARVQSAQVKAQVQKIQPIPEIRQKAQARAIVATPNTINRPKPQPQKTQRTPIVRTMASSSPTGPVGTIRGVGKGRILVMMAAGPSINEVNFDPIKTHPKIDIMCINQPHTCVWPTKYWAFCDHTQYRRNEKIWDEYHGMVINSTNVRARKPNQLVLNSIPGFGFSRDVNLGYHIGRSSTYANMQVAYYMDYDKVYIFGCDMGAVGGKLHSYGKNPDVPDDIRIKRFADEANHYLWAGKNLSEDIKKRFSFCSTYNMWEFTNYFEKLDHKEAIDKILELANANK